MTAAQRASSLFLQDEMFPDEITQQSSTLGVTVRTCGYQYAKHALRLHHYLGDRMPAGIIDLHSVEEHDAPIGAVVWSNGPFPMIMGYRSAELARVALGTHNAPVTHILAQSITLLKRRHPDLELLVSYADSAQGHTGVIYKAGNWLCAGTCTTNTVIDPGGVAWHDHSVWSVHGPGHRQKLEPIGWKYGQSEVKYRFWMPLTKKARKQLKHHLNAKDAAW